MPGYPVPEVDKEIFQELLCEYCDTVIRDAWRAECGHFYCRSCVEFLFRGNQGAVAYCRKCRTPLFHYQFLPDDIISSKVEGTIIHCLFLEAGCKWEGELKESECHVGSCSLASIQRGEQKECEGDITLSTGTDDEREFLLSDNVVENQIGTEADEDPIDEDSHTQRPVPAHRQEAQDGENPQNSSPTRETAACPECGINTDSSELVVRDGARRSETRRSCHGGGNAIVRKNHSPTRERVDCHKGGMNVCRADRHGHFEENRARRLKTKRSCNEQGSTNVMEVMKKLLAGSSQYLSRVVKEFKVIGYLCYWI